MSEEWKVIDEFPNYSICNDGRVRNDKTGRIRKHTLTSHGYMIISFKKEDGSTKQIFVHRLMAMAFIPNPENKPFIDHINRDKSDNRLENLRWVTTSENQYNIDVHERNKLQEKNIFFDKHHRGKQFCVSKKIEGKNCRTYFKTLEEAREYRDSIYS